MFNKLDKYLRKILSEYNVEVTESSQSFYYRFNGICIRLSNHIATSSDGNISIIISKTDPDRVVVLSKKMSVPLILSYAKVQNFIRGFVLCSLAMGNVTEIMSTADTSKLNGYVLGIPYDKLQAKHQKVILDTIKKYQTM